MTDADPVEQRLRRALRAVAEQPVDTAGIGTAPRLADSPPKAPRRRVRTLAATIAAAAAVAVFALALAYGPRSSTPGNGPDHAVTTQRQVGSWRAVLVPSSPSSRAVLQQIASILGARLRALGDNGTTVSVGEGYVAVSGRGISRANLQVLASTGTLLLRPVECGAPPYDAPSGGVAVPAPGALPQCGAPYQTTAGNLRVGPVTNAPNGYTMPTVPADPAFADYPSTPPRDDGASRVVLLPGDPSAGAQQFPRFVLGPAELVGADITGAHAQDLGGGYWAIDVALTPAGVARWDAVAQQNFHAYVAMDLDGQVLSAPLIEPTQSTFAPFGGSMEISGNFGATRARGIAAILDGGALPVGLELRSIG